VSVVVTAVAVVRKNQPTNKQTNTFSTFLLYSLFFLTFYFSLFIIVIMMAIKVIINIGTQSVHKLFFVIEALVEPAYSSDLFRFFGLRCTARKKLGIYECTYDVTSVMVR